MKEKSTGKKYELDNQLFALIKTHSNDLMRETIIHGCTGNYPPTFESLKEHVFMMTDPFMSTNEIVQIGNKLLWEVKFDEMMVDLLSKGVIQKSAKTGRYSGNKQNAVFKSWTELNNDLDYPQFYFPEDRFKIIEYINYGTKKILNTNSLKEQSTYKAVWAGHQFKVKVLEILHKTAFIGVGTDKISRPYVMLEPRLASVLKDMELLKKKNKAK